MDSDFLLFFNFYTFTPCSKILERNNNFKTKKKYCDNWSNYNGQFLEIEIIDMIRFLALLVEKGLVYIFIDHYRS